MRFAFRTERIDASHQADDAVLLLESNRCHCHALLLVGVGVAFVLYVGPALLVDDVVRIAGRIPDIREIKSFIVERPRYVERMREVA